jgi:membrane protease YdiL (CAAX protease family)
MSNPTPPSDDADSVSVGDDVKIGGPPSDEASTDDRHRLRTLGVAMGLGFGAIIVSLVFQYPIVVLGPRLGLPLPESPLALISLELFIGQVLAMGGLSAFYLHKTGRGLSYVSIRRPTLVESLLVIAAPFGIIFVTVIITQLSLLAGVEPSQHALSGLTGIEPSFYLYLVPLMILIVGPFEELLYRGVVQSRLRESFGPVGAIVLASLIFASIHLPAHGFGSAGIASTAASLTALFGGSLVFGGIYEWTENLTVVALTHGVYNGILLTLLYFVTVYGPELEEMAADAETALVLAGL